MEAKLQIRFIRIRRGCGRRLTPRREVSSKRNRVAPVGLEPTHSCEPRILNPLRIPVPPRGPVRTLALERKLGWMPAVPIEEPPCLAGKPFTIAHGSWKQNGGAAR